MSFKISFLKTNPSRKDSLDDDNLIVYKEFSSTVWDFFSQIFDSICFESGRIYVLTKEWFEKLKTHFTWLTSDCDWYVGVDL